MKYKTLLKKLNLKEEDFTTMRSAIEQAENKTDGEIAVAIAPESGSYSFWELLASNIFAIIIMVIMFLFSGKIRKLYDFIFWNHSPAWIIPACFIFSCFAAVIIGFNIANIPFIDRLIVPNHVKKIKVTNRAFRYFTESGIYKTEHHSGILIFISYLEHQVRIVADEGISSKISQDMWNLIADELAEEIKKGNTATAISNAVNKCGELLAEFYPITNDKKNELSNEVVILEGAECD
ncbi:MAG: TPM domain-containing protein [Treponema sp.]|nr:TPM domain-containing protein [Treponema sp.]